MSNEFDKQKHGERFFQKVKKLARKVKLMRDYHWDTAFTNPHKYHKSSPFNCGNPKCVLCMNPRKAFGEKTLQEKKFEQKERIRDD